jgi:hypothetical protein
MGYGDGGQPATTGVRRHLLAQQGVEHAPDPLQRR